MSDSVSSGKEARQLFTALRLEGTGEDSTMSPQIYVVGMPYSGKSALIAAAMLHAPDSSMQEYSTPNFHKKHIFPDLLFFEIPCVLTHTKADKQSVAAGTEELRHCLDTLQSTAQGSPAVIWYCINSTNPNNIEGQESIIESLLHGSLPLALVCTHVDVAPPERSASLFRTIDAHFPYCPCFFTGRTRKQGEIHADIHKLTEWSEQFFAQPYSEVFRNVRRKNLEQCIAESLRCVGQHTAIAFTAGAIPLPFADAPALVANQITMTSRLSSIWDIPELRALSAGGFLSLVVTQVGRSVARSLVGNLFKFIPGVGTSVGCTVNALVAASLTGGMGYALHMACQKCAAERLENREFSLRNYLESEEFKEIVRRRAAAVASEYVEKARPMVPDFIWAILKKYFSSEDKSCLLTPLAEIHSQALHCCGVDVVLLEKTGDTHCCNIFIHGFSAITNTESVAELIERIGCTNKGTNVLLHWQCGDLAGALKSFDDSAKDTFQLAMQRVEILSLLFDLLIEKALRGRPYTHVNVIAHSLGARMTVLGLQHCGQAFKIPVKNVLFMGGCVPWPVGGLPILQEHGTRCFNMHGPDLNVLGLPIPRDWALAVNPFDNKCIGRIPIEAEGQSVFNIRCEGVGHDYWPHVHSLMDYVGFGEGQEVPDTSKTWRPCTGNSKNTSAK